MNDILCFILGVLITVLCEMLYVLYLINKSGLPLDSSIVFSISMEKKGQDNEN